MRKFRLTFVGIVLTIAFTMFTSCTHNGEDFDPVLTEEVVNTELEDSKTNSGEEEEESGAGTTGTGPG